METVLSRAQAPTIATTMMASLYGAVRTWDDSLTLTDLFGYSGHAFILNIERSLCPSGPTAWDWGAILFPLRQILSLRRVCAICDMRGEEEARELIWQRTVESIQAGRPAILWDALLPEFYLAYGFDETTGEYLIQGPGAEKTGRITWAELGQHTGRVWALFPAPHESPSFSTARSLALRGAVTWHRWPNPTDSQWIFGGDAWNTWIAAMGEDDLVYSNSHYVALNHEVYAECRRHAADFLDAQGAEFADAAGAYRQVADALTHICEVWPFSAPVPTHAVRRELAADLVRARDAEAEGIRALGAALEREKLLTA
ncbi:MAG: hypothetical protein ACYDBB_18915 [Armatimonadota bacterium]